MNLSIVFVAILLAGCALAQLTNPPPGETDRLIIDTFDTGANIQGFQFSVAGGTAVPDVSESIWPTDFPGQTDTTNILGGFRDLQLTITKVDGPNTIVSQISKDVNGATFWEVATPRTLTAFSTVQWDGNDNDAVGLSSTGLGADLSDGGNNHHFHLQLTRDIGTKFTVKVASSSGICTFEIQALGTDGDSQTVQDVWIPFTSFAGSCSFSSVGGIEVRIDQEPNVDASLYLFSITGSVPSQTPTGTPTPSSIPSPSGTGTPTPVPSQSRTPTPTGTGTRTPTPVPSQSRTPTPTPTQTRTPTPTPSPECICICPAFTCALIFDADDDVNNVYYFTGPGFTFPDTDSNTNSNTNSLTVSNPFTGGNSGASVLSVSIAVIAVIVALF